MKNIFISILIAFSIISCEANSDVDRELQMNNKGLNISCRINKIKIKKMSEKDKKTFNLKSNELSYIYGEFTISNTTNNDLTYDLNDYYLSIGDMISSHIYIDSIASQIIKETTIKPAHTIRKHVYWVFDGSLSKDELMKVNLIIREEIKQN